MMTDEMPELDQVDASFFKSSRAHREPTEKQLDMIETLRAERGIPELTEDERKALSKEDASTEIDRLIKMPRQTTSKYKDVPAGRYALKTEVKTRYGMGWDTKTEWAFYKVDKPETGQWAGRVFLKKLASDDEYAIRGTLYRDVMDVILADPQKAMLDYGKEIKHCGHCGRTLTNEDSRNRGIGPVCAEKMGW